MMVLHFIFDMMIVVVSITVAIIIVRTYCLHLIFAFFSPFVSQPVSNTLYIERLVAVLVALQCSLFDLLI